MIHIEKIKIKGLFEIRVYNLIGGRLKLVEEYIDNNLVVSSGKQKINKLLANDGSDNHITMIGVGINSVAPTIADTSLTDSFSKNITSYSFPSQTSVTFNWALQLSDANGKAIAEYGLLCEDSTLFSRKTRGVINKESDVYIEGNWTINII